MYIFLLVHTCVSTIAPWNTKHFLTEEYTQQQTAKGKEKCKLQNNVSNIQILGSDPFQFLHVLSRKVLNPQLLTATIRGYQIISCFFLINSDNVVTRATAKYINVTSAAFLLYTNTLILYAMSNI